jgi:hypothetical protein
VISFFSFLCKKKYSLLRKIILYSLLVLFSFSYSYQAINYFAKAFGDDVSIVWLEGIDGEEKDLEDLFFNDKNLYSNVILCYIELPDTDFNQNINFYSADYSQQVYSPPEIC